MKIRILLCCVIILVSVTVAQDRPVFEVTKLSETIHKLSTDGGGYTVKVLASIGKDGILIVDAGQKETGEALKQQLEELGGSPKIIISSHSHVEHTAGNMAFGRSPLIIGHRNVRPRLTSSTYLFDEFPRESLPELEFDDSLTIRFNDEELRLIYFGGAHDNSDIIVWFVESKVVFVGAITNGFHFPSVDGATGDILKYPETVERLLSILPDDVTIVPGHGEDCTKADAENFHRMLVRSEQIVRDGLAAGKDLAVLVEEDALKEFESFDGSYTSRNQWIENLIDGIEAEGKPEDKRKEIYETMYYAIKENGVDKAIEIYKDMKANQAEEYRFDEMSSLIVGYKLYNNDRKMDAVKFLEISIDEYPEGKYVGFSCRCIATAYKEAGSKKLAIEYIKKALEFNPDDQQAKDILAELEK